MKHKVAELEGALLDAAVAKAWGAFTVDDEWLFGLSFQNEWKPSTSWRHGGPIIERGRITVAAVGKKRPEWYAEIDGFKSDGGVEVGYGGHDGEGPTPLIAAMRAFVSSKFGDEVELQNHDGVQNG